jgi:tRNA A37 threonylcarbamoyladenosine dehydratase
MLWSLLLLRNLNESEGTVLVLSFSSDPLLIFLRTPLRRRGSRMGIQFQSEELRLQRQQQQEQEQQEMKEVEEERKSLVVGEYVEEEEVDDDEA